MCLAPSLRSEWQVVAGMMMVSQSTSLPQQQVAEHGLLFGDEGFDAPASQRHHLLELVVVKRTLLGTGLDLDDFLAAGEDQVHVHFGARIFLISEVKQNFAVHNAHAGGTDKI